MACSFKVLHETHAGPLVGPQYPSQKATPCMHFLPQQKLPVVPFLAPQPSLLTRYPLGRALTRISSFMHELQLQPSSTPQYPLQHKHGVSRLPPQQYLPVLPILAILPRSFTTNATYTLINPALDSYLFCPKEQRLQMRSWIHHLFSFKSFSSLKDQMHQNVQIFKELQFHAL